MLICERHLQRYVWEEEGNNREPQGREEMLETQEIHNPRQQERGNNYR